MRLRLVSVALLCLLVVRPALADSKAQAGALYKEGMVHFQLDEYDAAIKAWEDGFRVRPSAEFLYNIAQAHRAAHRPEQAISYYKKFLNMQPTSTLRPRIEDSIVKLEDEIAKKKAQAVAPVVTPPPPVAPVITPAPVAEPAPVVAAITAPAPVAPKPVYKKAWFWGAVSGGVVVVAAAVALGVVFGTRSSNNNLSPVHLSLTEGAR